MNDRKNNGVNRQKVAPTMNEEESDGRDATKEEIEKGDSTTVTRLTLDEYDTSD
ncbi:hypothetical protein [Alteribacillus iranensis]|uniref:Uncharacterized protein n=1 Tax=Alteribacillus iranensis TaxID=930128 RepID=A0A1I2AJU2_9BACI|nr:hypothetical protein [Alteribacillus iranensis]SFE43213.1 hypothetical protein SAMN05192532_101856 [Alteribacillus iranensis]